MHFPALGLPLGYRRASQNAHQLRLFRTRNTLKNIRCPSSQHNVDHLRGNRAGGGGGILEP